jgi:hypothetical protein
MLELNYDRLNAAICATNSKPSFLLLKDIEKIVSGCVMQSKGKGDLMLKRFQCAYGKHIEDVALNELIYLCACRGCGSDEEKRKFRK